MSYTYNIVQSPSFALLQPLFLVLLRLHYRPIVYSFSDWQVSSYFTQSESFFQDSSVNLFSTTRLSRGFRYTINIPAWKRGDIYFISRLARIYCSSSSATASAAAASSAARSAACSARFAARARRRRSSVSCRSRSYCSSMRSIMPNAVSLALSSLT